MRTDLPSMAIAQGIDMSAVETWLVAHRDAMVDDLAAYVSRESPSTDKSCLDNALSWIRGFVTESLAVPPEAMRTVDGGTHGDMLLVDLPGVGSRQLLVLCHYDTVWEAGTLHHRPFQVTGSVATGPGVFDMKAGLVQGIWALRALHALGLAVPPVRLLLNGDEELGSPVSRPVIETAAEDVSAVLVLEPAADGALKTARKGVGIYHVAVTGVEAHAGLDPTKGASAIDELARVILYLRSLADLDRGTSVNVGTVQGGARTNVIAGHAHAGVDIRVSSQGEARRIEDALAAIEPSDPRLAVSVGGGWNRPVMERTSAIADMVALARVIAARLGLTLAETAVGGGSDANFVSGRGIPVLDGLGAVGAGAHSRDEHVDVDKMPERAALAAGIMHSFAVG